MGVDVVLCN